MSHTGACAKAAQPGCKCSCAGVQHGLNSLKIAACEKQEIILLRDKSEKDYVAACKAALAARKTSGRQGTQQDKIDRALGRCLISDVILYLHEDQVLLTVVTNVAGELSESVVTALRVALEEDADKLNILPRGHFWCGFLAALSEVLDQVRERLEDVSHSVRDKVIERLCERPFVIKSSLDWLSDAMIAAAVKAVWKSVEDAATKCSGIDEFTKSIRILGMIVCPDISRHPEVIRWCVLPLAQEFLSEELNAVFCDWLAHRYPNLTPALIPTG